MTFRSGNAYDMRRQMANTHTGCSETRRHIFKGMIGAAALARSYSFAAPLNLEGKMDVAEVRHSTVKVGPVTVFYREAGLEGRTVLLLLHGFANSSHYFRHLMPLLANRFHLIAPDLPSFGFTKVDREVYRYTFAQLTETTQAFVEALALQRFAVYVFDYGAPIGFNLAVADPSRITAIISQNGNAYEEGLGEGPWAPLRAYWKQPSVAIRDKIKERMSLDGVREAYFHGVPDVSRIEPEAYWLDAALLAQPGMTGAYRSISSLITKPTSNAIPFTNSTSGRIGLRCSPYGARTTASSFRLARKHSSETCPTQP